MVEMFEENRRNSFLRLPIRGSNPVASSGGGESFFRTRIAKQFRETEFFPMLFIDGKFGH
jgi:hypothetical protein